MDAVNLLFLMAVVLIAAVMAPCVLSAVARRRLAFWHLEFPQRTLVLAALRYEYARLAQDNPAELSTSAAVTALARRIDDALVRASAENYPLDESEVIDAICTGIRCPATVSEEQLNVLVHRVEGSLWILREARSFQGSPASAAPPPY